MTRSSTDTVTYLFDLQIVEKQYSFTFPVLVDITNGGTLSLYKPDAVLWTVFAALDL